MTTPDLSGMLRWPNVPACYGWLSLDRRGQWRMRGEPVTHAGLASFLNRQYGHDEDGNYFVQNGPQRVFVELEYTPWVLHLISDKVLRTHTGDPVSDITGAVFDEEGNLLLEFHEGIALLCDRDLPAMLNNLYQADGLIADDAAVLDLLALPPGTSCPLTLEWNNQRFPVRTMYRASVVQHYGFMPQPTALPAA